MNDEFEPEQLYGTWTLTAATAEDEYGRPLPPPYGPTPMGSLVLARNGRMMAVLSDGRPTLPAGEKRAYASYCGNFRIEQDRLITRVDAALIAARIGGEQVRRLELQGDTLILFPPRRTDGAQRKISWRRIGSD
ncbi:lipocalin-like domain-containing protein [Sphingobium sp. H39-3-25]|uniref:lipocalin-like domain-containing protein n=1 Tax=Sphingobium arseniciresistens TaxID=3030834 RepID=UPI0023B9D705|nr:lipocalin-like domain-containing protein [Sphingobium arseniciresistens]